MTRVYLQETVTEPTDFYGFSMLRSVCYPPLKKKEMSLLFDSDYNPGVILVDTGLVRWQGT